jgi:hypothetical protein
MRATCISNDPMSLADHQRSRAAKFEGEYPLTVGKSYPVLGICICENVLRFLVRDDWGGPCFAPAGFFEVLTARVPSGWMFALEAGIHASGRALWSSPSVAIWGYPELVENADHAAALGELEPEALAVFGRYWEAAEKTGTG